MKRILVPLDGTEWAASILPDAMRLAGPGGELVLVRDVTSAIYDPVTGYYSENVAFEAAQEYLDAQMKKLCEAGVAAETNVLCLFDRAWAIDEAARVFKADMIACATHGRSVSGRLVRGSIAWKAMAHSPVPGLLRHPNGETEVVPPADAVPRRILVPLDGSTEAERAIPLAVQLANEWHAELWLTHVLVDMPIPALAYYPNVVPPPLNTSDKQDARMYLDGLAAQLPGSVHISVLIGPVTDALAQEIEKSSITDVVMATHGRTGLPRVILGSVADELIHRLHVPFILLPPHAKVVPDFATVPAEEIKELAAAR